MDAPTPAGAGARVLILTYHQIGAFARPVRQHSVYCHGERFRIQMDYLAASSFAVIGLRAAYDGLFRGGPLPPRSIVLTFDDGYRNFRDVAWPILRERGFPATVFAVAGALGGRAHWLPDAAADAPLLDARALRELADAGVTVGSHALSHRRLGHLAPAESAAEIVDSKARLEDAIGRPVDHFCYPYGHYDRAARDAVAAAGYLTGLTCIRSRAELAANAFELPRQSISWKDTRLHYAYKLRFKHRGRRRLVAA